MRRARLIAPALALALAPGSAPASYDGGAGFPLSLPETLRGTVAVPLRAAPTMPADTLAELYPVLAACWRTPDGLDPRSDVEITARFSLRRDGSVIAQPRIVFITGVDARARSGLARATLAALRACTPARITPALGRAVAGRPIGLRLVHRPDPG